MSRRVSTAPLLLLLLAASAAGQSRNAANSHALRQINDRVISTVFTGKNEVVCTFCLFQVVSAAYQAGNQTVRDEIRAALRLGSEDPAVLSETLLQEAARLPTLNGTLKGYFQQSAFSRCRNTRTKRDQCDSIVSFLNKRGRQVDFQDSRTVGIINGDVERATNGKIKNLFQSLAKSTQLVFASALAFGDKWLSTLRATNETFVLTHEGRNVTVPTLINKDDMPYFANNGVVGVSIPYQNPAIRLYCFIAENGKDIRRELHQGHYITLANASEQLIKVRMPKFDIVSKKYKYEDLMQVMGMATMFGGGLGPSDNLQVDQVVHKAVIQANEEGTSAAGAAGFAIVPTSIGPRPKEVRFDRPFVCSLVHEDMIQPLFTTYVANPSTK